jgi:DNA-binding MarR family transcriptional regulator
MMSAPNSPDSVCAFSQLRRVNRSVTQLYDLALAPAGIKTSQFTMLALIEQAGEIAQCEFAREYSVSVETLSRRFAALRRKGWVNTRLGTHSERIYSLTERGKLALQAARPFWQNAQARLKRALGDADWIAFHRICEKTVRAAHEAEEIRTRNGGQRLPQAA